MGIWRWLKSLFYRPNSYELAAKLTIMKLAQDTHTYTLADLIERANRCQDFKHLVANGVANQDSRLKELEEKIDFLFKFASAQETRLDGLEERANDSDLDELVTSATVKSPQN